MNHRLWAISYGPYDVGYNFSWASYQTSWFFKPIFISIITVYQTILIANVHTCIVSGKWKKCINSKVIYRLFIRVVLSVFEEITFFHGISFNIFSEVMFRKIG